MTAQPELFNAPPEIPDVAWLEHFLESGQVWFTAKDIQLSTRGKIGDRALRELASASAKIISGQKGYRALCHASPEEINHAANWLESQASKMSNRACAIRREAHKIFG